MIKNRLFLLNVVTEPMMQWQIWVKIVHFLIQ